MEFLLQKSFGGDQGLGHGGIGEMLFKGINLQLVVESWRSIAQHSDYRQQCCVLNFKVAKSLDLNCSHHKKEIIM